jgi:hypothetical protein
MRERRREVDFPKALTHILSLCIIYIIIIFVKHVLGNSYFSCTKSLFFHGQKITEKIMGKGIKKAVWRTQGRAIDNYRHICDHHRFG